MKKGIYYEIPDKYKYSFACDNVRVRPIVSEDRDKYLALASASNLKKFLPKDINLEENIDILAWAGNFCVANKINLNDDCISNKEAIRMVELLPYKFCDLEHKRDTILGCILTAGYSEYGTDKPLTEDEIKGLKSPFNITIGGILWRVINPSFAEEIEKMGEPDAEVSASLSWEVAFSEADLIIIDKDKSNLEDGKIVSDASEIAKLESKLKSFGGSGYTDDGKKIARLIRDDLIPLGVGFVSNPAGQVGKIVTPGSQKISIKSSKSSTYICPSCKAEMEMEDEMDEDEEMECGKCKEKSMGKKWKIKADICPEIKDYTQGGLINSSHFINKCSCGEIISQCRCTGNKKEIIISNGCEKCKKSENSNSQSQKETVNASKDNIKSNKIMLKTRKDITDEALKEANASQVLTVLDSEIEKISKDWETKTNEVSTKLKDAQAKNEELEKKTKETEEKLNKVQENLNKLVEANEKREQEEIFNTRMNYFDSEYDLSEEKTRNIVARKIKSAKTEDEYKEQKEEIELLLAAKKKGKKEEMKEDKKEEKKETKASVDDKNKEDNSEDALDKAIDNGEKTKTTVAATTAPTETQADKWAKVFGEDGWEVDKRSFRK